MDHIRECCPLLVEASTPLEALDPPADLSSFGTSSKGSFFQFLACHVRKALWACAALVCVHTTAAHLTANNIKQSGYVMFRGMAVPGATVTAIQGDNTTSTVTNSQGYFTFATLETGTCIIEVRMQLFHHQRIEINVSTQERVDFDMSLDAAAAGAYLPVAPTELVRTRSTASEVKRKANASDTQLTEAVKGENVSEMAADALLISGSQQNAASTPFALARALGNNRIQSRSLYNGNLGVILNSAILDARAYSLTGQHTPKPDYNRVQALLALGGPIRLPRILHRGTLGTFSLNYQRQQNRLANLLTALVPTVEQRNILPANRIALPSKVLLDLYPLPNSGSDSGYNYQVAVVGGHQQDNVQANVNLSGRRSYLGGAFGWQSDRKDSPDVFGFVSTLRASAMTSRLTFRRSLSSSSSASIGLLLSRTRARETPYFAFRSNISGLAGISGNNQRPENWGPPNLVFASGITSLSLKPWSVQRDQTAGISSDWNVNWNRHSLTFGVAYRRHQYNLLTQENPRGTFAFTGASDFTAFLLGQPDTAAIAYGNPDKYLRGSNQEAYMSDDWRVTSGLTITGGIRWEYRSPLEEKYGRLVNLAIGPAFSSAVAVTQQKDSRNRAFPRSDRNNVAPRLGFAWRPLATSSMVVRGGYGLYYNTSVYHRMALQMSQQAPLSTSVRLSSTPERSLTLSAGFTVPALPTQTTTFGVDPDFRVGYSQNWQLTVQRDLPMALQLVVTYSGIKGTRAEQQFLPNTFPDSFRDPVGFTYLTSNGNSIRHAGRVQLRRRLRTGVTGVVYYTYAKSIDNASLGGDNGSGLLIAQDWLNLRGERARSNFDQRHVVSATLEYTTRGRRRLLAGWSLITSVTNATGLPLTPIHLSPVPGTGVVGTRRPNYTGVDLYDGPPSLSLNPLAFAPPVAGQWGTAGRNSINGPDQFQLDASLSRTFREAGPFSIDCRLEVKNALNIAVPTSWIAIVGSAQYGIPTAVNPMRSMQVMIRTRF